MTVTKSPALLWLGAAFFLSLAACGGATSAARPESRQNAPSPELVQWTYQPNGLTLNLTAEADLNPFEGFTHNLLLCVYQLSDPTLFEALSASEGGIEKLLTCASLDPGMVEAQRHFVSPGESTHLVLARAAGARYVGLVAGYNDLQPGKATALHPFPVTAHRHGWWPWSKAYAPGTLTLQILLNANSIHSTGVEQ